MTKLGRKEYARVLYSYNGTNSTELNVVRDDLLVVRERSGEWWECELRGTAGLVPGNYVSCFLLIVVLFFFFF
jgi:hypothetical protein